MSNDGNRVIFESNSNINGGNGDGNYELYAFDRSSPNIVQLTNTQNFTDPSGAQVNVNNVLGEISGDGRRIVFLSNAQSLDPANPNNDGNVEIHITDWPSGGVPMPIKRITDTGNEFGGDNQRNVYSNNDLAISDDGDTIAFVTQRQVFHAINGFQALTIDNPDRDIEVMVCRVSTGQYTQVTHSDPAARPNPYIPGGVNVRPKLSGNGTVLAWISDFDYANANPDQNDEIFITQVGSGNIRQITQTNGQIGGAIVPILDPSTGTYTIDIGADINVWAPYDAKTLDAGGTNIVFESSGNLNGSNPNKARQVWLYNVPGNNFTRITNQTVSASPTQDELRRIDHDFCPGINSTGTFITFNSSLDPVSLNSDGSKEIFRYEINSGNTRQLTFTAPSSVFSDQRLNTYPASISDGGDVVSFEYLSQSLLPNVQNVLSLFQVLIRPIARGSAGARIVNSAYLGGTQVARGSLSTVLGSELANTTPSVPASAPFTIDGVTVTVGGIAARLTYVSPGRIGFVVPNEIANGDAVPFSVNNNGVQSAGTIKIVDAAPGVFSMSGDGTGPGRVSCLSKFPGVDFYSSAPCAVSNGSMMSILIIGGTGWRNGPLAQVRIGGQTMTSIYSGPRLPLGDDQINLIIPAGFSGMTDADLTVVVPGAGTESNTTKVTFQNIPETLVVFDDGSGSVDAGCLYKTPGQPDVSTNPPCAVSNDTTMSILVIKGLGWRSAPSLQVRFEEQVLTPIYFGPSGFLPDLVDQINLILPSQLAGRSGQLSVFIPGTTVESNKVNASFLPLP